MKEICEVIAIGTPPVEYYQLREHNTELIAIDLLNSRCEDRELKTARFVCEKS